MEDNTKMKLKNHWSERIVCSVDIGLLVFVLSIMVGISQFRVLSQVTDSTSAKVAQAAGPEHPVHRKGMYRLPVTTVYSPPLMSSPVNEAPAHASESIKDSPPRHEYRVRLSGDEGSGSRDQEP